MPVYEYRCKACGHTSEIEHGFHDERPTKCPLCGGQLARIFHPVGVVFKGSGFYKTDQTASDARKDSAPAKDGAAPKGKAAEGASSDSKPAGEKKSPVESKPQAGDSSKSESGASS